MVVRPSGGFHGTIGGGALEWRRSKRREALAGRARRCAASMALGPELGQCCGGRVEWRIETFDARDLDSRRCCRRSAGLDARPHVGRTARSSGRLGRARRRRSRGDGGASRSATACAVYLFGAGHVGRALALALAPLPFAVRWIDSRGERSPPARRPMSSSSERPTRPRSSRRARRRAYRRDDPFAPARSRDRRRGAARRRFGYVGLIGSATKRAVS